MKKKDEYGDYIEGGVKPLGDLVNQIMRAFQLEGRFDELNVLEKWEEMMGRAVASRTRSISIQNKVLILELDSAVMREELKNGKNIIIQRVNQESGKEVIVDVFFK